MSETAEILVDDKTRALAVVAVSSRFAAHTALLETKAMVEAQDAGASLRDIATNAGITKEAVSKRCKAWRADPPPLCDTCGRILHPQEARAGWTTCEHCE